MAQYEDVGLRARIDGVSGYTRDAQRIQQENRRIEQSLRDSAAGMNREAGNIINSLKPIAAAIAGAFVFKAGTDMFRDALMGASDLSETVNKVDVVFGDAAGTVKQFADNSAQAFGLSRNQALSAAGTFGNLFRNIGLTEQKSAEFSNQLVQNAADLASFNNIDPTEVLDKLRAGLSGEAEPLRVLGIDVSDTRLQIEALSQGITKSTQDMTQAEKVALRYAAIQKQMGAASGDFARTSDGVANSLRRLRASFADAQAELGNKLLPTLQPIISAFASGIPNAVQAAIPVLDGIGRAVASAVEGLGRGFQLGRAVRDAFAGGDVQTAFNLVRVAFTDWVAPAVRDMLSSLQQIPDSVIAFVRQNGPAIAAGLRDWAERFGGWALDAVPQAVANLSRVSASVLKWVADQVPNLVNGLTAWTKTLSANVSTWWTTAKPQLETFKSNLVNWINSTDGDIKAGTDKWRSSFVGWADTIITDLAPKLAAIKREIDQMGADVAAALITRLGQGALDAASKLASNLGQGIRDGKPTAVGASAELATEIWFPWAGATKTAWNIGRQIAENIANGIKNNLPTSLEDITGRQGIFAPRPPALQGDFIGPVLPTQRTPLSEALPKLSPEEVRKAIEADLPPETAPTFPINVDILSGGERISPNDLWDELGRGAEDFVKGAQTAASQAGQAIAGPSGVGGAAKKAADAAKDALKDAEYAVDDFIRSLEASLQSLSARIRVVDAQIKGMARIRFTGMDEAEDELYQIELQAKKAQLAILQGETGKDAASKIKEGAKDLGAAFDELSAQQREVREGIPVALQRWQWEQEQARRRAEEAARKAAEPKRETGKKEKTAAEKELEALERAAQIKRLQIDIQFGPQLRQWEKLFNQLTGKTTPTFGSVEEAQAALQPLLEQWTSLTDEEQATRDKLMEAKGLKEEINILQREEKVGMEEVEAIQGRVNEMINGRIEAEATVIEQLGQELDIMQQIEKVAERIWNSAGLFGPPPASEGDEYPGMAIGGRMLTGGGAVVGEQGPERVILPAGATVLPASSGPANISRSYSDTWNISGGGNPVDIANQLSRMLLLRRMTQGRDDW